MVSRAPWMRLPSRSAWNEALRAVGEALRVLERVHGALAVLGRARRVAALERAGHALGGLAAGGGGRLGRARLAAVRGEILERAAHLFGVLLRLVLEVRALLGVAGAVERLLRAAHERLVLAHEVVELLLARADLLIGVGRLFALARAGRRHAGLDARAAAAAAGERRVRPPQARREIARGELGVMEVVRLAGAGDAAQIGGDDLAEVQPELAQLEHLLAPAVEHGDRRVEVLLRAALVALFGGGERARRVVGDVGQALRDVARVARGDGAEAGVEREQRALGLFDELLVRGRRRALLLGVEGAPQPPHLTAREREHAAAQRHEPAVRARENAAIDLAFRRDVLRLGLRGLTWPSAASLRRRWPSALLQQAIGEQVGQRRARLEQRGVAARLGLAHLRRDDHDRRALAPLRPGDDVVVLRLDRDRRRRVALLEERIGRAELVAAAIGLRVCRRARERPPLLFGAAAQHEIDLAQAVIVGRLVVDRDARLVDEVHGARRAVDDHDLRRRLVRDRRRSPARPPCWMRTSPKRAAIDQRRRVARPSSGADDAAGAVVDEGDVGRGPSERTSARPAVKRACPRSVTHGAARDRRSARTRGTARPARAGTPAARTSPRRPRPTGATNAPRRVRRRARRAPRRRGTARKRRRRARPATARRRPSTTRAPACARALEEQEDRHAIDEAREVERGELRRAGVALRLGAIDERERAQRGGAERGIDERHRALDDAPRVLPPSLHDDDPRDDRARRREQARERGDARALRAEPRDERRRERGPEDQREHRAPRRRVDDRLARQTQPGERRVGRGHPAKGNRGALHVQRERRRAATRR